MADGIAASATVDFRLACKQCGGGTFRILSHPLIAPEPSPYFEVAPGEVIYRSPHRAECVRCGEVGSIFDGRSDGYDGVLNGGCSYETGAGDMVSRSAECAVTVSLTYNCDLAELREFAVEAGVHPADLFDWIAIVGQPTDGGVGFAVDYECA
jgi:hypothetical protein